MQKLRSWCRFRGAILFNLLLGYVIVRTTVATARFLIDTTSFNLGQSETTGSDIASPKQLPTACTNSSCRQSSKRFKTFDTFNLTSQKPVPTVCDNETCRSIYAQQLHRPNTFPIPKIRHILWRNQSIFVVNTKGTQFALEVSSEKHSLIGGTYADLDYSLVRSLDETRRFHAVVTREPEAHSLLSFGPSWPIKLLLNPAFIMSTPGHSFHRFVLEELAVMTTNDALKYGGPFGLSNIIEKYRGRSPMTSSSLETVYVPPSYSFYPYKKNSLLNSSPAFRDMRIKALIDNCCNPIRNAKKPSNEVKNLTQFCTDVTNMNPITDSSQPVYAVHDVQKSWPSWGSGPLKPEYTTNIVDAATVIGDLKLGADFL